MPYILKKFKNGFKVCKKDNPKECFSKEPMPLENAKKQKTAIILSELRKKGKDIPVMEGGLKPLTARVGGKVLLKKKLVNEFFPPPTSYTTYVEPFVGGGSVYFFKQKDNHKEVVNDIDPDIYEMFKGFQTYDGDTIAKAVNGDYTKKEFEKLRDAEPTSDFDKFIKTFLMYRLSFFGRGKTFGKPRIHSSFSDYKERLKGTTILNKDYKDVIKKYDGKNTFFYLDPPVRESTGKYYFPAINVEELVRVLNKIKGKFLLSWADTKIKKDLFKDFNIYTVKTKYVGEKTKGSQSKQVREYIITNYDTKQSGGGKSSGMDKFHKQLESVGLDHETYMKAVKVLAKRNGYDPSKVEMSDDGVHKLVYHSPEGLKRFGRVGYGDFIIWNQEELNGNVPKGYADQKRYVFRTSHGKIKDSGKYSPNQLSINLLW